MKDVMRHLAASFVLAGAVCAAAQPEARDSYRGRVQAVLRIPGLAAFWDFVQREDGPQGTGRFIAHTRGGPKDGYALEPRNIPHDYWRAGRPASYADFPLLGRGPFGQAVHFPAAADRELRPVLAVPRARLHGTPLDVKGPRKSVSMVAWIIREDGDHAIAGIWHEGTDISPPEDRAAVVEPGRRQYALFAGLAANPGAASAHVSENGRASFGDRYARNLAVTIETIPRVSAKASGAELDAHWTVVGFTFDNQRNCVTAYIDGKAAEHWVEEPAKHPFYRHAARAWQQATLAGIPGLQPGEDPAFPRDQYYQPPEGKPRSVKVLKQTPDERLELHTFPYTRVRVTLRKDSRGRFRVIAGRELAALKVNPFWFPHDLYSPPSREEGGPFTIGRVIHSRRGAGMAGYYGGVAVYTRALTPGEMAALAAVGRAPDGKIQPLELRQILSAGMQ
jgi:hypothetical protein